MPRKRSFIKQFLQDKKMVGSVRPSSRFLAEKMLQNIDFSKHKIIIELGPGTGVFTYEIIEKMAPDAILLVFELNKLFIRSLRKKIKDKRVILINDSAEKLDEYLQKNGLSNADIILSSLPLSNFPQELKETIVFNSNKALTKEGKFIQFQYSLQSKKMFQEIFSDVSITFTPLNFPPAFVYCCLKKSE
jgi:phosphatidylethanolamine/phosphatidyl-N-methylethanolamine N-methyltransferase